MILKATMYPTSKFPKFVNLSGLKMLQKRHSEIKKLPAKLNKPGKLKTSQLPKKDIMRSQLNRQKIGSVQVISNPMRASSTHFAEKPVYSQILDDYSNVYRDRKFNFDKKELTAKINENRGKGFVMVRKSAQNTDVPIKLNMI